MKKLLFFTALLSLSVAVFAQVIPNSDKIIENFYSRGKYIKVVKDESNISYYNKEAVLGFIIDEDDFYVLSVFNPLTSSTKGEPEATNFNFKRWNINADAEGNIILTRRKK